MILWKNMRSVCNCGWYETRNKAQRQNQCVLWVGIKKIGVNESRTAVGNEVGERLKKITNN